MPSATAAEPLTCPAPAQPVIFSEDYYQQVVREHGYDTFELERFTFDLARLSASELNVRWLCHHRATDFLATPQSARIITTGFGMSGVPHMGTVSQIRGITRLQEGGERCQIVLGDLDAHNGKARPLGQTRELADRFAGFCRRMGFDDSAGILRSQFSDIDCLRNMYLLGFYVDDADFERAEEDNHHSYVSLGIVDDRMTFRRKVSLALMASDFVTLAQDFDAVLVMLGVDEHKYVLFTREVAQRFGADTSLRGDFTLASVYSRLTSGFGGHPKMSKSIPGSSINMTSAPEEIVARVMGDQARTPETSPAYQLICQMFFRPYADCLDLAGECAAASPAWRRTRAELAEYLISITELW
jgi:tryptophanyl-tRNA synthetase